MEGEIAKAYVTIGGDTSAIKAELEALRSTVTSQIAALGVALTGPIYPLLRAAQGAFSMLTAPISILKDLASSVMSPVSEAFEHGLTDFHHWVKEAMEAEVTMARFNSVFEASGEIVGATAEQFKKMRENMASGGMFDEESVLAAQKMLLQMRDVRGDNFVQAMKSAGDLSNLMGIELPQAARMLGMALSHPEMGMRMLRRAGIMLSKAELDHIKVLQQTQGSYAAQAAMLDMIQAKTGDATGKMAETTHGRINMIRNTWNSLGRSIGEAILPVTDTIARFTLVAVQSLRDVLHPIIERVGGGIKGAMEVANKWLTDNKDTFRYWAATVSDIVGNVVDALVKIVQKWMPKLDFKDGKQGWETFADAVTDALDTLAKYSTNLTKYWKEFKDTASDLWSTLKKGALDFIDYIKKPMFDFIDEIGKRLSAQFKAAAQDLMPFGNGDATRGAEEMRRHKDMVNQGYMLDENNHWIKMNPKKGDTANSMDMGAFSSAFADKLQDVLNDENAKQLAQEQYEERRRRRSAGFRQEGGDVGALDPSNDYGQKFKFGSAGFADLAKQIQHSVSGSSTEQLSKLQLDAAKETAKATKDSNTKLAEIKTVIEKGGFTGVFAP